MIPTRRRSSFSVSSAARTRSSGVSSMSRRSWALRNERAHRCARHCGNRRSRYSPVFGTSLTHDARMPTTRSTARVAGQPRWGSGASGGAGTVVPLHALRAGSDSARKATRLISNGHSRCEPGPFVTVVSGSDPAASSPDGRRSGSTRIDIRSLSANTRHRASTMDALVESVAASVRTRPTRAPQQIQSQMSKRISQFSEAGQHQYPRHCSE